MVAFQSSASGSAALCRLQGPQVLAASAAPGPSTDVQCLETELIHFTAFAVSGHNTHRQVQLPFSDWVSLMPPFTKGSSLSSFRPWFKAFQTQGHCSDASTKSGHEEQQLWLRSLGCSSDLRKQTR